MIFGIQVALGMPLSVAFLFSVAVSNIPQALAPSADLAKAGWSRTKMAAVWGSVVLACGVAAPSATWLPTVSPTPTAWAWRPWLRAGLLAMLTNSLIPFAYDRGGAGAGFGTVVGFAISLML
ncbi:MAG: hypothetical protein R2838_04205 [Caldilineaceae bacterium]